MRLILLRAVEAVVRALGKGEPSNFSQLTLGREQVSRIVRGADEVLLPAVVLGELLYGFRHGSRYARDMRAFLDNPYVSLVPVGATTADRTRGSRLRSARNEQFRKQRLPNLLGGRNGKHRSPLVEPRHDPLELQAHLRACQPLPCPTSK